MLVKYKRKPYTWPPNPAIHTPCNLLGTALFQVPNLQEDQINTYKETLGSRIYIKTEETRLKQNKNKKVLI
jgi:hypothetical protein